MDSSVHDFVMGSKNCWVILYVVGFLLILWRQVKPLLLIWSPKKISPSKIMKMMMKVFLVQDQDWWLWVHVQVHAPMRIQHKIDWQIFWSIVKLSKIVKMIWLLIIKRQMILYRFSSAMGKWFKAFFGFCFKREWHEKNCFLIFKKC